MTSTRRAESGFTIIELLVTVVILAIASSLAIYVNGRELRRERINAATTGLAGWIEEVRRSALRGNPCTITITANPGAAAGTTLATAEEEPLTGQAIRPDRCQGNAPYRLPSELANTRVAISPSETFVFGTLGTVDPVAERVLTLTLILPNGQSDLRRCIRIRGMLGFLEMGVPNGATCSTTSRF